MYVFEIIFMYVCIINDVEPGFQAKDFDDVGHAADKGGSPLASTMNIQNRRNT